MHLSGLSRGQQQLPGGEKVGAAAAAAAEGKLWPRGHFQLQSVGVQDIHHTLLAVCSSALKMVLNYASSLENNGGRSWFLES